MMRDLEAELALDLAAIQDQGLTRRLRRIDSPQAARILLEGRPVLNFSSNDYLGFANDPTLREAAREAIAQFGAGSGAARLISGSLAPHDQLEQSLAAFKGTAAALSFSSGYAAALGTVTALLGRGDTIILDRLVHASFVDAARLAGAKLRVFRHNDLGDLERILRWADAHGRGEAIAGLARTRRILVVTESIFSMDGDQAPLAEIVRLKNQFGAWLLLDEAHATGLHGQHRQGLAEAHGLASQIEIQMGTLGKAIGAAGGYICGSRRLIDLLMNRARSFIFSTAPVPAAAAAAAAGIEQVRGVPGQERCALLWQRIRQLSELSVQFLSGPCEKGGGAIFPVPVGEARRAVEMSQQLQAEGIFVPGIRYPTVARGRARLRVTMTASHTPEDVAQLAAALGRRLSSP